MTRRGQSFAVILAAMLALPLPLPVTAGGDGVDLAKLPQVLTAIPRDPTLRYNHDIFGRGFNHASLTVLWRACATCKPEVVVHTLPEGQVVEDLEGRIADFDGDGTREALVVVADLAQGAMLTLWGPEGQMAASAPLGQAGQALTIAGLADFDLDGRTEVAYVANPHTDPELVFARLENGQFVQIAHEPGLTNHSFGDSRIRGGVRRCGQGPELVVARADGLEGIAAQLTPDGRITTRSLGGLKAVRGVNRYLRCTAKPQPLAAPAPAPTPAPAPSPTPAPTNP